jgi:outer membrane protein assembly factor BamB
MKVTLGLCLLMLIQGCGSFKPEGVKPKRKFFSPAWIKNLDVPYNTGNLPIGLQSPAIHEGILYVGHNIGVMKAFDLTNGRKVWFEKEDQPYHSAPIVHEEMLIYGNIEGRLYARKRLSGELIYNVDLGAAIESQPVVHQGRLLVHTRNHKVVCLDALTGKILWAYKRSVPFLTTLQRVSRPAVRGNKVYVGFADGFVASFSLQEGILLWESKVVDGNKFIDVDSHPTFFAEKIIVGSQSGPLTVINPTGGLIERRLKYFVARAPLIVNNYLLIGTSEGELVRLDENFEEVAKIKVSDTGISSMAIWKNKVVAATISGELVALEPDLSGETERFSFGHSASSLFGKLMVSGETLAAYSSRNRLYVFR